MPRRERCKNCKDNDSTYGCMNTDCEVWQDVEAEYKADCLRELDCEDGEE